MPYTITTFGLLVYFICVVVGFFASPGKSLELIQALAALVVCIGILFRR